MISYDEALQQVLENVSPLPPVEVCLNDALGLVLASQVTARWDMPRCDNSAMDGFAVANIIKTSDVGLTIVGSSFAGHPYSKEVNPGDAVRITTGAMLPKGTDTVVPIEEIDERDGRIYLTNIPEVGQHVRYRGEEYKRNEILIEPGTILRAGELALLASAGIERVKVFPSPRVALISTGDELIELGQKPDPGQIINSNLYLLRARLTECGFTPVSIGIGIDDPDSLDQIIDQALKADAIISTGGVSVGEKDQIQDVLERKNFKKIFWKVAIKPGKPVLFGKLEGKPYFGLPGNPAATAVTFELFAKPGLKKLAGQTQVFPEKRKAVLTNDIAVGGGRQSFLWCKLEWQEKGYKVTASQHQGSGQNRCLFGTNAILRVPIGYKKLCEGEKVEVFLIGV